MGQLSLSNEFVKQMGDLCPCHKMLQTWCKYRLLPKSLSNSPDEFVKFYQQGSPNSIKKLDHRLYQGMCFQCNVFKKIAIKKYHHIIDKTNIIMITGTLQLVTICTILIKVFTTSCCDVSSTL